jgi:hypothetical protein
VAQITGWHFVTKAKEHVNHLQQLKQNLQAKRKEHNDELEALRTEHEKALLELAEYAMPKLDPEVFRQIKNFLGYGQFLATDPIQKMQLDQEKKQARLAQLNQDPRVQNSDIYIHPNTGNISLKIQESQEQLKVVDQVVSQYSAEPRLLDLFENGYKTPAYKFRWWNANYYSDWKWGDIYEEKFGKTIEAMSTEYQAFSRDKATLEDSVRELTNEKNQILALVKEQQELKEALADFPNFTLRQCHQKLVAHLRHADKEHLFNLAKGDPARESLIKKIHGIEKKNQYLQELGKKHFTEQEQYIDTIIARVNEKITKFSRPKKSGMAIPQHEIDKMLPDVREKIGARDRRFNKQSVTIVNFHQYDYYDYQRDMLWWDVMTDGRIDGNFIPEVNEWHHHHPNYTYQHHDSSSNFFDAGTAISNDDASTSTFGDPS